MNKNNAKLAGWMGFGPQDAKNYKLLVFRLYVFKTGEEEKTQFGFNGPSHLSINKICKAIYNHIKNHNNRNMHRTQNV